MPDSMSSKGRTNSLEYNLCSILTSFIAPTPAFNNYWNKVPINMAYSILSHFMRFKAIKHQRDKQIEFAYLADIQITKRYSTS